jgi:hypothetical protein
MSHSTRSEVNRDLLKVHHVISVNGERLVFATAKQAAAAYAALTVAVGFVKTGNVATKGPEVYEEHIADLPHSEGYGRSGIKLSTQALGTAGEVRVAAKIIPTITCDACGWRSEDAGSDGAHEYMEYDEYSYTLGAMTDSGWAEETGKRLPKAISKIAEGYEHADPVHICPKCWDEWVEFSDQARESAGEVNDD